MTEYIQQRIEGRIATVTLNRPEKRNALNPDLIAELTVAFSRLDAMDEVKVVILKANGTVFSAGADLEYLQKLQSNSYEENLADSALLKDLFCSMYFLSKPLIAQVQGNAIAGGCGLASVCDFVFAVPEAMLGYSEAKIGFVPALVSAFLLRRIGEGRTAELLLSAELIDARTACNYGLVNYIVRPERIEEEVVSFANRLATTTSSEALKTTKELLREVAGLPLQQALERAVQINAAARLTPDCKKGIAAFLRKERPRW